jgi:hypothetical protein
MIVWWDLLQLGQLFLKMKDHSIHFSIYKMFIHGTKPPESAIRQGLCNDLTNDQANEIVNSFATESLHLYMDHVAVSILTVTKM